MFREMVYSFLASGAGSHASPRRTLWPHARNRSHGPARRGGFGAFGPDTLREWPDFERSKMRTVVCWPALFRLAYDRGATVHR